MTTFVSSGYFLTHPIARPDWAHASASILPARVLTLSGCLASVVPSLWPTPSVPPHRPEDAWLARIGIAATDLPAIDAWFTSELERAPDEWPVPFFSIDALRSFVDRFVAKTADVALVGVALPIDLAEAWLAHHDASGGASERYRVTRRGVAPDLGGEVIGFEVLGDGATEEHSVICTGSEKDLHDALGISFGAHGLIHSLDDARRAAAWMSEDGHGEPVPYFPWQLTRYLR